MKNKLVEIVNLQKRLTKREIIAIIAFSIFLIQVLVYFFVIEDLNNKVQAKSNELLVMRSQNSTLESQIEDVNVAELELLQQDGMQPLFTTEEFQAGVIEPLKASNIGFTISETTDEEGNRTINTDFYGQVNSALLKDTISRLNETQQVIYLENLNVDKTDPEAIHIQGLLRAPVDETFTVAESQFQPIPENNPVVPPSSTTTAKSNITRTPSSSSSSSRSGTTTPSSSSSSGSLTRPVIRNTPSTNQTTPPAASNNQNPPVAKPQQPANNNTQPKPAPSTEPAQGGNENVTPPSTGSNINDLGVPLIEDSTTYNLQNIKGVLSSDYSSSQNTTVSSIDDTTYPLTLIQTHKGNGETEEMKVSIPVVNTQVTQGQDVYISYYGRNMNSGNFFLDATVNGNSITIGNDESIVNGEWSYLKFTMPEGSVITLNALNYSDNVVQDTMNIYLKEFLAVNR